jgi:hypothetical protein
MSKIKSNKRKRVDEESDNNDLEMDEKQSSYRGEYFKAQLQWQNKGIKQMKNIATCNLFNTFTNVDVLPCKVKCSASQSVIAFGRNEKLVANNPIAKAENLDRVALKISFHDNDWTDNTLQIEREILQTVTDLLVTEQHTPNLILFLYDGNCDSVDGLKFQEKSLQRQFNGERFRFRKELDIQNINVLAMEQCVDGNLGEFITTADKAGITEMDWAAILVQIYWTLACFNRIGLRHNDLHTHNILIRKLSKPEDFSFQYQGKIRTVTTPYIVKIYDFDRGSIYYPGIHRSFGADWHYCHQYSQCNGTIPLAHDIARFHMDFLSEIDETLQSGVRNKALKNIFEFVRDQLFGKSNYENYSHIDEALHVWLIHAEKKKDHEALKQVKIGIDCLLEVCERYNIQPVKKSTSAIVFKLPVQLAVNMDNPKKTDLEAEHYQSIRTCQVSHSVKRVQPKTIFTKAKFTSLLSGMATAKQKPDKTQKKWNVVFQTWMKEMKNESKDEFDWFSTSFALYQDFCQETRVEPINDGFLIACMLLTCPMYYGLSDRIRTQLLHHFANFASPEQIKCFESTIWSIYYDTVLPVEILLLYKLA